MASLPRVLLGPHRHQRLREKLRSAGPVFVLALLAAAVFGLFSATARQAGAMEAIIAAEGKGETAKLSRRDQIRIVAAAEKPDRHGIETDNAVAPGFAAPRLPRHINAATPALPGFRLTFSPWRGAQSRAPPAAA